MKVTKFEVFAHLVVFCAGRGLSQALKVCCDTPVLWKRPSHAQFSLDFSFDFGCLCFSMPRFVVVKSASTKICKNCSILFLFQRQEVFSIISFRCFLVCSSNVTVFFWPYVFLISIDELYQCSLTLLPMFVRLPAFFLAGNRFLTRSHYLQKRELLPAERRM